VYTIYTVYLQGVRLKLTKNNLQVNSNWYLITHIQIYIFQPVQLKRIGRQHNLKDGPGTKQTQVKTVVHEKPIRAKDYEKHIK